MRLTGRADFTRFESHDAIIVHRCTIPHKREQTAMKRRQKSCLAIWPHSTTIIQSPVERDSKHSTQRVNYTAISSHITPTPPRPNIFGPFGLSLSAMYPFSHLSK